MIDSRTRRWLPVLAVSMMLGACTHPANRIEGVTQTAPPPGPGVDTRVVLGSTALGRKVRFGDVLTRQEGLLLHVQVAVENTTTKALALEYRWEWTDATGFQLGDTLSAWQPAVIGGNERKLMTGVGPGPGAVNFRLYLREAGS